jgi:hypothetical protein
VLTIGRKVTVHVAGEEQRLSIATAEALPGEKRQLVGVDPGDTTANRCLLRHKAGNMISHARASHRRA